MQFLNPITNTNPANRIIETKLSINQRVMVEAAGI